MKTKAEVFIIESLKFTDERKERSEGQIISRILSLSGKKCEYYYVRTEKELRRVLGFFTRSNYRYLHLSCHGSRTRMFTTLDVISFSTLADILRPRLRNRRLFVSACNMANERLARAIIPKSGCTSILGPDRFIAFSHAAIFWASLYHVLFAEDSTAVKSSVLRAKAQSLSDIYGVQLNYFGRDLENPNGYNFQQIEPRDESTA